MAMRILGGCMTWLWLCALAAGMAALTPEHAQAQSCRGLQSQLASAVRGAGNRARHDSYADAALRQAHELRRARRAYQDQHCAGSGARHCRSLASTIQRMRSNLAHLERMRDRNGGGASQREIRRLEQAVRHACRRTASVRRHTGTRTRLKPRPRATTPPSAARPDLAGNYRTLCVRTCDGYFFPISFATHAGNLGRDAAICSALCPAAPSRLFIHASGDDEGPRNMTALDGTPYTDLATAFDFRDRPRRPDCACGRANTALIGIEGVTPPPGTASDAALPAEPGPPSLKPLSRPDGAADPETVMNGRQGLTVRHMTDIARSVGIGEVHDVADGRDGIRVVGGEFLPDPEEAIDLRRPAPTLFP